MPTIKIAQVFELSPTRLAVGLPDERCVRLEEARAALDPGTIIIAAGRLLRASSSATVPITNTRLPGTYGAAESVILPAYIVAGPGPRV